MSDVTPELEADRRWQLVRRIVASPQFARSTRLKDFLQYVARCTLLEHGEQVTEQQIGVHVFGRPADYSAGEDNIVRSQARFLRAKLAEYFEAPAGQDEPVVLTIPKGSYLPRFEARREAAVVEPPVEVQETKPDRGRTRGYLAVVMVAAVFLGTAVWWRWHPLPAVRDSKAVLWSRIFEANRQTTIVASDYIFSMVQEAAGRNLTLDEYLGADYFKRVGQLNAVSGLERLFPNIALRHYTGFENVSVVARLSSVKESTRTVVRFARDMTMRDIGAGNLILLGSKQSNPWVSLFEDKLNFRFEYQGADHSIHIVNRTPKAGEEAVYRPSALDALSRDIYGGIAFLPNLNRGSNVLMLQGTSMAGPEAALDIVDNPALFRDLTSRVASGRGDLPYFEALIRTRTVNGVAGESSIIASRVLSE